MALLFLDERSMVQKYTTNYRASKYIPESTFQSKSCGTFTILGRSLEDSNRYFIQFNTGYITSVHKGNLSAGKVTDPTYPSVCSVGFVGIGKFSRASNEKEYTTWYDMIYRCYSGELPTYTKVDVCPTWHNFQTFCADIQELKGYNEWKTASGMELDKDLLSEEINKIYSRDTCQFICKIDNLLAITNSIGRRYRGTRLSDGYSEEFTIQRDFCRKYGLTSGCVSLCISGSRKTHAGWEFKEINRG